MRISSLPVAVLLLFVDVKINYSCVAIGKEE